MVKIKTNLILICGIALLLGLTGCNESKPISSFAFKSTLSSKVKAKGFTPKKSSRPGSPYQIAIHNMKKIPISVTVGGINFGTIDPGKSSDLKTFAKGIYQIKVDGKDYLLGNKHMKISVPNADPAKANVYGIAF